MGHAMEWQVVPDGPRQIDEVARRCRRLVNKRALVAAGVSIVPLPGVDWITDISILLRLIPDINRAFGLTPEQVARLAPDRRLMVYKAIMTGGSLVIGRLVTRGMVLRLLRLVGIRLSTQQVVKYIPIAGQIISAALTFTALKVVCEQHIRQCMDVSRQLKIMQA